MLLAIDCGNSFLKWGLHDGTEWIIQDCVAVDDLSLLKKQWSQLGQKPTSIIVSNVANQKIHNHLYELISIWSIKPHWITSMPYQCGVTNQYDEPSRLGSDRWASLIAAKYIVNQSCLVVNVGTAMTIDALTQKGYFLGGLILPGPDLIIKSLTTDTAQLSDKVGCYQDFPSNTNNAIFSGVIHSTIGAIERMQKIFSNQLSHPVEHCVISGGGAHKLLSFINSPVTVVNNLVLEGLVIIAADFRSY